MTATPGTDQPQAGADAEDPIDESIGAIVPDADDGDDADGKAIDLPLEPGDANSQPGA